MLQLDTRTNQNNGISRHITKSQVKGNNVDFFLIFFEVGYSSNTKYTVRFIILEIQKCHRCKIGYASLLIFFLLF